MIKGDFVRKGDMIRAVIKKVEMRNNMPHIIIISRTDNLFLESCSNRKYRKSKTDSLPSNVLSDFRERAKVAVESYDDRIDPVGACRYERKQDTRHREESWKWKHRHHQLYHHTSFTSKGRSPRQKYRLLILTTNQRRAAVFLKPDQVSLAIGKGGSNIKLAGRKLVDYEIDV